MAAHKSDDDPSGLPAAPSSSSHQSLPERVLRPDPLARVPPAVNHERFTTGARAGTGWES